MRPVIRLARSEFRSQMPVNSLLAGTSSRFGMPIAFDTQLAIRRAKGTFRETRQVPSLARLGCRAASRVRCPWVGTHSVGRESMASRRNRSGWYVSGASKFLWTDFGALFGVIAVAGFALFRAWF